MKFVSLSKVEKRIFTIALVVKILLFIPIYMMFGTHGFFSTDDSWGYMRLAGNIVHEQIFSDATEAPFIPDALNTPGYPFYLAITAIPFNTAFLSILIQIVLLSFVTVLFYRTLSYLFSERVSFVSTILFAVEPWNVYTSNTVLSEAMFLVFFISGLYFFVRSFFVFNLRYVLFAGFLLSIATIIRPVTLYFLPLFFITYGVYFWIKQKKNFFVYTLVCFLALYSVVGGWSFRNYIHFNSFSLTTKGAYTLYFYDAGQFLVYKKGILASEAERMLIDQAKKDNPEVQQKDDLKNVFYGKYLTQKTFEIIGKDPILYAKMHAVSFATLFFSDGYRLLLRELRISTKPLPNISLLLFRGDVSGVIKYLYSDPLNGLLFLFGFLFWIIVNLCAIFAPFFVWYKRDSRLLFLVFTFSILSILYFGLITGPVAQARYRVPITLFLFPMAIYTLFALYDKKSFKFIRSLLVRENRV